MTLCYSEPLVVNESRSCCNLYDNFYTSYGHDTLTTSSTSHQDHQETKCEVISVATTRMVIVTILAFVHDTMTTISNREHLDLLEF